MEGSLFGNVYESLIILGKADLKWNLFTKSESNMLRERDDSIHSATPLLLNINVFIE